MAMQHPWILHRSTLYGSLTGPGLPEARTLRTVWTLGDLQLDTFTAERQSQRNQPPVSSAAASSGAAGSPLLPHPTLPPVA